MNFSKNPHHMDDNRFSHQIAAWLEPEILINSAMRLDKDHSECLKVSELYFGSEILTNGENGNFSTLVKKFLSGFEIPHELLQVISPIRHAANISDQAWDELASLKFEGQVTVFSHGESPQHNQIILSIKDRDVVLDVVQSSILGLLNLVTMLAKQWKKAEHLSANGAKFVHQPTMPSEIYAYIDRVVGDAYVNFIETPGDEPESINLNNRYRAVTVSGYIKENDPFWRVASQSAADMALMTMQSIKKG